jgi:riboflavin kinase/FMN adenylyltransferase
MMNIGTRPTFGENKQTLEVHVLDYSGYLYGKTLSVEFLHRLRDEHRFVNVEELRRQLETDAREVREYLQKDHLS